MGTTDEDKALVGQLRVRCDAKELEIFIAKAERTTGKTYAELIREIITAFNDDKLRIIPTKEFHAGKIYSKF
jgi:hypothetical protein